MTKTLPAKLACITNRNSYSHDPPTYHLYITYTIYQNILWIGIQPLIMISLAAFQTKGQTTVVPWWPSRRHYRETELTSEER